MPALYKIERFGERLRQLRKDKELTQGMLAERAGISVQMVSQLERGINQPTLGTAALLACALDVSLVKFLEDAEPLE